MRAVRRVAIATSPSRESVKRNLHAVMPKRKFVDWGMNGTDLSECVVVHVFSPWLVGSGLVYP